MSKNDNSPYLLVDEEKADMAKSDHVLNPLSVNGHVSSEAKCEEPTAQSVVPNKPVFMTRAIGHFAMAVCSFVSFALMGSIPGINVQSGIVTVQDLLLSSSCTDKSLISGSINFNAFRFVLVVGVLCWLYSSASTVLLMFQKLLGKCATNVPQNAKFNIAVMCCDITFLILTFLAFMIGACFLTVPQKLDYVNDVVYFTVETFYLTIDLAGMCPSMPNPLPPLRGSMAMMFFTFAAACLSVFSSMQLYNDQIKAKKSTYQNCL